MAELEGEIILGSGENQKIYAYKGNCRGYLPADLYAHFLLDSCGMVDDEVFIN